MTNSSPGPRVSGARQAGKSTLVKILGGAVRPGSGELLVDGEPVTLNSPRDSLRYGIAAVHQELSLVPELTVAENILLGRLPGRKGSGGILIDWEQTFASARRILDRLELSLDVRKTAGSPNCPWQISRAALTGAAVVVLLAGTNDIAGNTGPMTLEMIEDNYATMAELARAYPESNAGMQGEVTSFTHAPRGPLRMIATGLYA